MHKVLLKVEALTDNYEISFFFFAANPSICLFMFYFIFCFPLIVGLVYLYDYILATEIVIKFM